LKYVILNKNISNQNGRVVLENTASKFYGQNLAKSVSRILRITL